MTKKHKSSKGIDDLEYWSKEKLIIGIDDAGRGCICGSMFFGLVCFKPKYKDEIANLGLNDSKKLTTKKRFELEEKILPLAKTLVVEVSAEEINTGENLNDLGYKAINKGLQEFSGDHIVFMDGLNKIKDCPFKQINKPKFDSLSWHVSAASILAKNAQVRAMMNLHNKYPNYGFIKHNGYWKKEHIEAIKKYGMISEHRKSWIKI